MSERLLHSNNEVIESEVQNQYIHTYDDMTKYVRELPHNPEIDQKTLAQEIAGFDDGRGTAYLIGNIDQFPELDRNDLAEWLSENNRIKYVLANPDYFPDVDMNTMALHAIKSGSSVAVHLFLLDHPECPLDRKMIAEAFIENGRSDLVESRGEYGSPDPDIFADIDLDMGSEAMMLKSKHDKAVAQREVTDEGFEKIKKRIEEHRVVLEPLLLAAETARSNGDQAAYEVLMRAGKPHADEILELENSIWVNREINDSAETNRKVSLFDAREHYEQNKDAYIEAAKKDAEAAGNSVELIEGEYKPPQKS